ncbi:hypothetical protein, partial [Roseovarius sp. 2305UL8-3]|uniref:hypothetical protein n=1 Tax=Roseovarius conchicola TaxID=3121636 RepID=UPI0035288C37
MLIAEEEHPFVNCAIEANDEEGQFVGTVRRQGFWDRWRPELREGLAHLVVVIMRRICGGASVAFRWS